MDLASFWNLIDQTRREANGDPEHQVELLRERLSELESDEVVAFDRHFVQCHEQAYTWDLWGAAFVLAFKALPLMLVMSALSALLFHWRVLPLVVGAFSWALSTS